MLVLHCSAEIPLDQYLSKKERKEMVLTDNSGNSSFQSIEHLSFSNIKVFSLLTLCFQPWLLSHSSKACVRPLFPTA